MSYVIASSHEWYPALADNLRQRCNENFVTVRDSTKLTMEYLKSIRASSIFFPHWSIKIPAEIYEKYECIMFHMTDLPFGRGGSPLQNLIARGIYETKITSFRCVQDLDAGPVYLKKPLFLYGSAEEIYIRASKVIEDMIVEIIKERPEPKSQGGDIVLFKRRTQKDGEISKLETLEQAYDFIRMLDAEGYPKAYLETDYFRFEFSRSSMKIDYIVADVIIKRRTNEK